MNQDTMELLAGVGYGVVKGVVKSVAPESRGAFKYMDDCIKNVSGAATIAHPVGEAIGKGLAFLIIL